MVWPMPNDIHARLRDLAASATTNPGELRPVLLRVATDLFALNDRHTGDELRLYEEMAGRLIDGADESVLAHMARKLSRCLDAPPALLARIRARGGEPARELLRGTPGIERRDLLQTAAAGACDQACVVAGRADLDREIVRALAARPEREILRALAANRGAQLGPEVWRLLAARGRSDHELARALLGRGEPTLDGLPLFLAADAQERALLLALALEANLGHAGRPEPATPLDAETAERVEAAANRRNRASIARILAERLFCDLLAARRLVDDEEGDALALAFVAVGVAPDAAARILLAAFPAIALSPEASERVMRLIRTIPRRVALRMVEAMAGPARDRATAAARAPISPTATERLGAADPKVERTSRQNRA
jgi:uncharacterized protein (DUF2336 family)